MKLQSTADGLKAVKVSTILKNGKVRLTHKQNVHTSLKERLLYNIYENLDNGCWEYCGYIGSSGYGKISDKGKNLLTHRVSYELHIGKIPDGLFVLHKCDNRICLNPDHLWAGTLKENTADMHNKKRNKNPQAENSHLSKFTNEQVIDIFNDPGKTLHIAKRYGVCKCTITDIRKGRTWKSLNLLKTLKQ